MEPTDRVLRGLGAPRPLPAEVRARLEEALLRRDPGAEPAEAEPLGGVGTPRAIPPRSRSRLEGALVGEADVLLRGVDAPRPVPASARARLERALAPARPERWGRATRVLLAAAAAMALVAGSALVVTRTGTQGPARPPLAEPARATPVPLREAPTQSAGSAVPGAGLAEPRPVQAGAPPAAAGFADSAARPSSPAPPFADSSAPAPEAGAAAPAAGGEAAPQRAGPAGLAVAFVGGDAAQEAGFRAYVRLLNESGGAGGHRLDLVAASTRSPAPADAVATVNLSATPIAPAGRAPAWARAPVLETLAVPETALRADVFDLASAPERQAHLIADAVFPEQARGETAAIYIAGPGVFADRVPAALEEVLRARGVTVARVAFEGGAPVLVPADASFLSMGSHDAREWLRATRGDARAGTVAGVFSVADEALLTDLPQGARAVSPYALPRDGAEVGALRERAGRPLSAAVVHGWVTAKALAVAVWRSGADTAAEVRRALEDLPGYETGFAPYRVRAGSHSRTPEGIVLEVRDGAFVSRTGFLTDPF